MGNPLPNCTRVGFLAVAAVCVAPAAEAASGDVVAELLGPVFRQRCVQCHGEAGSPVGEVDLAALRSSADLLGKPNLIRDLVSVLDAGVMPPPGAPALQGEQRDALVAELRRLLHAAAASRKNLPRTPMRRMNRFQYGNAVQDLLELSVDVFALPERMLRDYDYFRPETGKMPDSLKAGSRPLGKSQLIDKRLAGVAPFPQDLRAEHGYDNRGDHLTMSPLLLEAFLKLGRSIVDSVDFSQVTSGAWERLFVPDSAGQGTESRIRAALRRFLSRAFRRPASEDLLDRYVAHAMARIESGEPYADAMKGVISAALASPRFLYLYESAGPDGSAGRIDDFELASRLSFFLWGSIPDEELLDLAGQGRLLDPAVLRGQVERMMRDARVKRFCDSFPSQWLQLERIVSSVPDPDRFPAFYFAKFRSSMHMMLEPLLLFETVLVEDRPILDLVDPGFSYRSDLLESWYRDGTRPQKVPPVAIPFRRVPVTDRRQGGVITNAAVMTMTSGPARTNPITRGAWIAGVIFNDPPDPPPADVPLLPQEDGAGSEEDATLRERFALHRTEAACASCHAQIDPLGFALENYGPTGVWRDAYDSGQAVDPAGVLFGRYEFRDIVEFKDAVLAEKERFARAFAGHLLEFALARDLEAADEPALDRIVDRSAGGGYRIREMMVQVALSEPFLSKYSPVLSEKGSL